MDAVLSGASQCNGMPENMASFAFIKLNLLTKECAHILHLTLKYTALEKCSEGQSPLWLFLSDGVTKYITNYYHQPL